MKSLVSAVLFAAFASSATAGALTDPIVEPVLSPVMIEDEAASSSAPSGSLVIALSTLIVFGAALGK